LLFIYREAGKMLKKRFILRDVLAKICVERGSTSSFLLSELPINVG